MLWRLLQVYWLLSVLDIRCMAFDDTSTIKVKTRNNGIIDPYSFDVFPTSSGYSFGKLSKNDEKMFETEENDPDMDLFFKDVDFFKDDDSFYKSPFGKDNMKDFFSKGLEESRNRYKEDVDNIDEMFEKPVKSSIDELLRGETTHVDTSSKNINNSEEITERTDANSTRSDTVIPKTNNSNSQIPPTNSVHSLKPNTLSDINRAARSNAVAKLEAVTERDNKHVVDNVKNKDENRKTRGSDINDRLVGSQNIKSDNPFINSMTVITEISVQETVNGNTVERKPSSDELRLIETKILGSQAKKSSKVKNQDDLGPSHKSINNHSQTQDEDSTVQDGLPNDVIVDLSSFLKVDPNFADDGEDKMLIDDEEVKDMDVILSDKDEYDDSMPKGSGGSKNEEDIKNISGYIDTNGKEIGANNVENNTKDPKMNITSPSNQNTDDPRNYRKIFHTEHKNSSNVSDVKIMFSETEGDFLDDNDDDGSEYSLNITEQPENNEENKTIKNSKTSNRNNKQLNASGSNSIEPALKSDAELHSFTDLPVTEHEDVDQGIGDIEYPKGTTTLSQVAIVATESPETTEFSTKDYNEERTTYSNDEIEDYTEVTQPTTVFVTENVPTTTEKEEVIMYNNDEDEFTTPATISISTIPDNFLNINPFIEERISLSSQNINATMHPEEPVTELYEELEEPIPKITEDPFFSSIDRTMALLKQILYESGSLDEKEGHEKSQDQEEITTTENPKETEETVTIPLDTSTVAIDSTSPAEEFTGHTNHINNMEVTTDNRFITELSVAYSSTVEPDLNTVSVDNVNTERNIITTEQIDELVTGLAGINIEIVNTNNPRVVVFKDTEIEPHEISPSEVESMYNSKIEEYESLEDSEENRDRSIFGKEHERKVVKDPQGGKGVKISEETSTNTVLISGDKQESKKTGNGDGSVVIGKGQDASLVSVLNCIVLNNTAEFSIKIATEDEIFYVPSTAYVREYANTINITWETSEYLNNSIALKIFEQEQFYIINEIMVNLLTGNEFKKLKKSVDFVPLLDDSISEGSKVVRMKDGTYIYFSNVDFLKKNYDSLEYSEASMRERRLWHIEIAFICLAIISIICIVFYVVAKKTKRKITLREKNELAQVTHC